jgi:hypothetical protein
VIAALYVEKGGVYYGLPDVDPWDEERDARLYDGPWPVVAHPPCAAWCRLAGFREFVHGLPQGEDGGCFEAALHAVRTFGGILEHPAHSAAWDRFGLPVPLVSEGWTGGLCGGWSAYVEQRRYGMPLRKPTWFYAYGLSELPALRWGVAKSNWNTGKGGRVGDNSWWNSNAHNGKRGATPIELRDVLLSALRAPRPSLT